jgi:hypothetical protein
MKFILYTELTRNEDSLFGVNAVSHSPYVEPIYLMLSQHLDEILLMLSQYGMINASLPVLYGIQNWLKQKKLT